jgi:hypothetical protein
MLHYPVHNSGTSGSQSGSRILGCEAAGRPGAASAEEKVSLIVGVTKDLTGKVQMGKIVGLLAAMDWR